MPPRSYRRRFRPMVSYLIMFNHIYYHPSTFVGLVAKHLIHIRIYIHKYIYLFIYFQFHILRFSIFKKKLISIKLSSVTISQVYRKQIKKSIEKMSWFYYYTSWLATRYIAFAWHETSVSSRERMEWR